jgi:prevent-host-death family protein
MTMILINIHEAKAKLSEYVEAARKGERVLICRHNRPVAELRPVDEAQTGPRDLSPMYAGATFMTAAFFDPMSRQELEVWEGSAPEPGLRVAESRAPSTATRRAKRSRRGRS